MHNTRVHSIGTFVLCFLLCLSYGIALMTLLLKYSFYLFIAGIPAFSIGGHVVNSSRCFDLYTCSQALCNNTSRYIPDSIICGESESLFLERMPGWMRSEYTDFPKELHELIIVLSVNTGLYVVLPLLSLLSSWYNAAYNRILNILFSVLFILMHIVSAIITQSFLWSLDEYNPVLPVWLSDTIFLATKITVIIIWLQTMGSIAVLIYNQITQVDPNIDEFQPLFFRSGRLPIYTEDEEEKSE